MDADVTPEDDNINIYYSMILILDSQSDMTSQNMLNIVETPHNENKVK